MSRKTLFHTSLALLLISHPIHADFAADWETYLRTGGYNERMRSTHQTFSEPDMHTDGVDWFALQLGYDYRSPTKFRPLSADEISERLGEEGAVAQRNRTEIWRDKYVKNGKLQDVPAGTRSDIDKELEEWGAKLEKDNPRFAEWRKNRQAKPLEASAKITLGTNGNVLGDAREAEESLFTGIDLQLRYKVNDLWSVAVGINEIYFDDAPWSKSGADNYAHNYRLGSQFLTRINNQLYFTNTINLDYGDIGRIALNDITDGLLQSTRTWLRMDSTLYYRPDGKELISPGWRFSGRHRYTQYNQSGDNFLDTATCTTGLHATRIVNPRFNFFGGVSRSDRDWRDADFDSETFRIEAGVSGLFPCGTRYRVSLHQDWRRYDNRQLDDNDMFGYNVLFSGDINVWQWGVFSSYGFMDPNLPHGGWTNLADATGKRYGSYVRRDFDNDISASLFCYGLFLDGEIFDFSDIEGHHIYSGIEVKKRLRGGSSVSATIGHQVIEYDWGSSKDKEKSFFANIAWLLAL